MQTLAIFVPDDTVYEKTESLGSGTCRYIHFCSARGFLSKHRLYRRLRLMADGAATADAFWAAKLGLPLLQGDGRKLILSLFDKLLPPSALHCVAALGSDWNEDALLRFVRKTPYPELVGPDALRETAERLSQETGAAVPLFSEMPSTVGKQVILLPGTSAQAHGNVLDLRDVSACAFAPPPLLRSVCAYTGASGDILEGLLSFFALPSQNVGIFCRITQNAHEI